MKIEPVKNYKKPGYAVKLAAFVAAAGALTGCTEEADLEGATSLPDDVTTGVATVDPDAQIDGGMVVVEDETGEVSIEGEVTIDPDGTTEVQLAGDVAVVTEESDKPYEMGMYYADMFIDALAEKGINAEKCESCYGEYKGKEFRPIIVAEDDKVMIAFFTSQASATADGFTLADLLRQNDALKDGNTYITTLEYKGELYLAAFVDIADSDVLSFAATAQLIEDCMS